MMLTSVFTKAIRDRWMGMAVAVGIICLWLPMAMAIYSDIDVSVYTTLPEGIRELMGIPDGADPATLAYNVMLDFAAAMTVAGMAVSIGAASIAGEERNGTIGVLLSNPETRSHLLWSKIASLVVLVVSASAVLWGVSELAPIVLNIEIGETHLGAMMIHLGLNAVFYGSLAIAVGSWTGSRAMASALPAAIMAVSYFAVGLLPLVQPISWLARVFPWYYFSSSQPLINGLDVVHLAVLGSASIVLVGLAHIGVNRRDLRGRSSSVSLVDRLRNNPLTDQFVERFAGSTRVSTIWRKAASEHQALLFVTAGVMFTLMGVLMGPMYTAIDTELAKAAKDFPETVLALAGNADMGTPEGWFTSETFSIMAPVAVMVVAIVIGARGLAGEESDRTMGLLLSNPVRRSSVVLHKAFAMALYAVVVGVATFTGVSIATLVSGLGVSVVNIGVTSVLVTLLGLAFGAFALALSAATGSTRIATYGTVMVALSSHLLNSFLPLSARLAPWARLTPHHYFLSSDPLVNGMPWIHAGALACLVVVPVGASVLFFEKRDLRTG